MNPRFVRLLHRAHDLAAARAFYAAVLGPVALEIASVPPAAAARGVPAHWLGAVGVDDVAGSLTGLLARGGTALGPVTHDARGSFATVRDAGGALLALTDAPPSPSALRPVWAHLDARDAARTFAGYAALFGWTAGTTIDLGAQGTLTQFAWEEGGAPVGSYLDLAGRPEVHAQWTFHFHVAALDGALQAVCAHGGVVLGDVATPDGARIAICDDPQGGGFALRSDLTVPI